eukprot:4842466-Karenia_brevis.AAC.1
MTANTTCAKALKRLLGTCVADVVFAQELRVAGTEADSLRDWARRHGWKCLVADAVTSETTGRRSAGVGIFVRDHLGLGHLPDGPKDDPTGRAIAGMLEIPGAGRICVVSAYLWVGEELSARNLDLLRTTGEWCSLHRMPFIIGADWNMHPSVIESTTFADILHAAIVADMSTIGTCTSEGAVSTIDYFIMSADLAEAAHCIRIVPTAPIATHRPVLLEMRSDAASMTRIVAVSVQRLPPVPVFGPWPRQREWSEAMLLAKRALRQAKTAKRPASIRHALSQAYRAWAYLAEEEIAGVAGVELRQKRWRRGNRFKTESVPLIGSTRPCSCSSGVARRWLCRRAQNMWKSVQGGHLEVARCMMEGPAAVAPDWFNSCPDTEQLLGSFAAMMDAGRRALLAAGARAMQQDGSVEADEAEAEDFQAMHDFVLDAAALADEAEKQDAADE